MAFRAPTSDEHHRLLVFVEIWSSLVHFWQSSLSANWRRVPKSLRVVERVSEGWVEVALWCTIVVLIWIKWGLRRCIHELRVVGLLELLIDHFFIPHLLLTHLLTHFFLQGCNFLLETLLHLLLNNASNERPQVHGHCLEVLELIFLRRVL